MSNLGSPISPTSPSSPSMSRRKAPWARRIERCCCSALVYTPLAFVYGLTTWAAFVEVNIGFQEKKASWTGRSSSLLGLTLYGLLNWSYTVAVFRDPGSPLDSKKGYSHLPTNEPSSTSFTVKSTGKSRFCKKCQARKPDRAHHCSSCRRCVLKMDHHCPWLATCLGLRNYKAFVLFLTYTTVFCWVCFAVSASWVWTQVLSDGQYADTLMPVNYILLTVISGIIGLVLTGFTGWHLTLACRGQTTIECLEQTRYLSPLRKSIQQKPIPRSPLDGKPQQTYGQQLREIHANIIPGITRPEEGEERPSPVEDASRSPAQNALRTNYDELERMRERERYEDYLDERDSDKLPHAFDLGIKENLYHLFGPSPLLWCLPICNTSGDGWTWKPSPKWLAAREQIRRDREQQWHDDRVDQRSETMIGAERHYLSADGASGAGGRRSPYKADRVLGRNPGQYTDYDTGRTKRPQSGVSMHTLHHDYDDNDQFEVSSDEDPDQENNPRLHEGGGWGHQHTASSDREQSQRLLREREQRSGNGWEEWTRET